MLKNTQQKLEAVKQLEASSTFPKQDIYFRILNYIIKEEQEGRNVKSSAMAIDLMKGDADNLKTNRDSYMRAKIFSLRKDLNIFYLSEGKNLPLKVVIPKGKYKVELVKSENIKKERKKIKIKLSRKQWLQLFFIFNLVLLTISLYFFFSSPTKKTIVNNAQKSIASLFISNNKPLDIVLGDRSFYYEYDPILKRNRFIFDTDVEYPVNEGKFSSLIRRFPERKIKKATTFQHTDIGNIHFANELSKEWGAYQQNTKVYQSTQKTEVINNLIFISKATSGDIYETLFRFFSETNCMFSYTPQGKSNILSYDIGDSIVYFSNKPTYINEKKKYTSYILIKKVQLGDGHEALFLLPGTNAARNYLTEKYYDDQLIEDLLDSFKGKIPNEFEILLEVKGGKLEKHIHNVIFNSTRKKK